VDHRIVYVIAIIIGMTVTALLVNTVKQLTGKKAATA
jgi:fructose-specific phosphotransferase system IIC component